MYVGSRTLLLARDRSHEAPPHRYPWGADVGHIRYSHLHCPQLVVEFGFLRAQPDGGHVLRVRGRCVSRQLYVESAWPGLNPGDQVPAATEDALTPHPRDHTTATPARNTMGLQVQYVGDNYPEKLASKTEDIAMKYGVIDHGLTRRGDSSPSRICFPVDY